MGKIGKFSVRSEENTCQTNQRIYQLRVAASGGHWSTSDVRKSWPKEVVKKEGWRINWSHTQIGCLVYHLQSELVFFGRIHRIHYSPWISFVWLRSDSGQRGRYAFNSHRGWMLYECTPLCVLHANCRKLWAEMLFSDTTYHIIGWIWVPIKRPF